ncbi:MAG TPA: biotin/lipoyl-containing protein, partial [Ilumatobacteraceae bacterium]|nr:biotin/lipoyl-containing protein [Ilumatobacteraceae bacterium]
TGWLDRQELTRPEPTTLDVAAAALALVRQRATGNRFPIGWRNNPSQLHRQPIGDHVVEYRFDRGDRLEALAVDGDPIELDDAARDALARIDATVHSDATHGDKVHVRRGMFALVVPPRFVSPDEAGRAGTTVAPMPGKVVRLLVAAGDEVVAGQPLLTIEAMKMEHQIVAPHAGVVREVFVAAGQQLDHGQPLLRVG